MINAYWKDIWRSIAKGKKRFLSIAMIAVLGVTMMCGLRAACKNLRNSADRFFDEQNLFDIQILSTLGFTQEDVEILESLDYISCAEGGYNETAYTFVDEIRKSIEIRTLSEKQLNIPYLLEGEMPQKINEIVITKTYKNETGKGVGDEIILAEETENLKSQKYKITGIIIDVMDINSTEGSMGFRSTARTDYVGYVIPKAADCDIYTVLYLQAEGVESMNSYTDEYQDRIDEIVHTMELEMKKDREQSRYDAVYGEAMDEWLDGQREMKEEFARADEEIADARQELLDGKQEIEDAKKEIADGKLELEDGKQKLQEAKRELEEGKEKLKKAEALLNSQEQEANIEFAKARQEIEHGYAQIAVGQQELDAGYEKLQAGQQELDQGKAELTAQEAAAQEQIQSAWEKMKVQEDSLTLDFQEYEMGKIQLEERKNVLLEQKAGVERMLQNPALTQEERVEYEQILLQLQTELDGIAEKEAKMAIDYEQLMAGKQQLEAGKEELLAQETAMHEQFALGWAAINEKQVQLDAGLHQYQQGIQELQMAKIQLADGEQELNVQQANAKTQIANGRKEIQNGWNEIRHGEKKIKESEYDVAEGERELAKGEQELAEGEKELKEGEQELSDNIAEYEKEKVKAEKELADALDEINDIEMTKWYLQDRTSLSGYSNVKNDADSIQAIGDIFPVLFLVVAILVSLTTITRMVEEERGLIGTYKALGFTSGEIRRKYLIYAALACLLGGMLGYLGGYVVLPGIIFVIFHVMYTIPEYFFQFDVFGVLGILLFEAGVLGATYYATMKALRQMPAKLMRPKAPKSGSRVFLEKITFVWKRLSFLNKVTARNLFRYKKRLFMTVFGIAGCTALLLCGFTIKDTVAEMMPQQYEYIYQYDLMAISSDDDYQTMEHILTEEEQMEAYLPLRIESVDLLNTENEEITIQMMVVPDEQSLEGFIYLRDAKKEKVLLKEGDILLTKNATRVLDLDKGEKVRIQTQDLVEMTVQITEIVDNYFGNVIYMTESTYKTYFEDFAVNGMLANLSEMCENPKEYTHQLAREECVLSAVSTQAMKEEFDSAFALLNMVVYVILVLAAMLAFVVLFTLSSTNISERERELATIKVLGFYYAEVHSYVNKETVLLSAIGILAGMPGGWLLGRYVMGILKLPSLEFYIELYPQSYLYGAMITFGFTLIVNFITDRVLDKINMVEALKSVE